MSKNKPNNPALWSRAKAVAKSKFDVYPSAYANLFASKWYKKNGGTWKKSDTNENYMFDDKFIEEMQVLSGMIAEAKKQEPKKKDEFEEFAEKRQAGAEKIIENARAKGGVAKLTMYHFEVKIPFYKNASDGKFDFKKAEKEYKSIMSQAMNLNMSQKKFQELLGQAEVIGELILKNKGK